jgi:hypothetical protein
MSCCGWHQIYAFAFAKTCLSLSLDVWTEIIILLFLQIVSNSICA